MRVYTHAGISPRVLEEFWRGEVSEGPGICWELMKNLICSRHLLTKTTDSVLLLQSPVLLALAAFEASWLFSVTVAEAGVGGVLEIRPALRCQRTPAPGLGIKPRQEYSRLTPGDSSH